MTIVSLHTVEPDILSKPDDDLIALIDTSEDQLSSFICIAAGLPAPTITWTYIPNLDGNHEISLSDGENYQIVSNISEMTDGLQVSMSSVTFLELTVTDGGVG